MKKIAFIFILLVLASFNTSCVTTSTYGATFSPVSDKTDVYTLKIYYGGPPPGSAFDVDFQEGTDSRLYEEAQKYMQDNPKYISYKVVDIEKNFIPSYFLYTVRFVRE